MRGHILWSRGRRASRAGQTMALATALHVTARAPAFHSPHRGAIGAFFQRPHATNAASAPSTKFVGSAPNSPRAA